MFFLPVIYVLTSSRLVNGCLYRLRLKHLSNSALILKSGIEPPKAIAPYWSSSKLFTLAHSLVLSSEYCLLMFTAL
jgi:hypothetical protein